MRFLLLLLLFTFSYSLTLEEVVSLALRNNLEGVRSEIDLRRVEERIKEARGRILPTVAFSARFTKWDPNYISSFVPENKYLLRLSLSQPLFDRSLWVAVRLAKRSRELQEAVVEDVRSSVKAEAEKLYWAVLLRREILKEKERSLKYWEDYFRLVEEKFREGMVPKYEFLRARAQLRQARADLIRAESSYRVSLNSLKNFIGIEGEVELEGTLEKVELKVDDPYSMLLERNTTLLVLNRTLRLRRESVELKKAEYYPKLNLFANYSFENIIDFRGGRLVEDTRDGYSFGLNLDFVLFEGGRRARVVQEELEELKVRREIEFKRRELLNQLDSLLSQLRALEEELLAREDTLLASEEFFRNASERYREGVGSQLELLEARRAYENARLLYLEAIYSYNALAADIKRLLNL